MWIIKLRRGATGACTDFEMQFKSSCPLLFGGSSCNCSKLLQQIARKFLTCMCVKDKVASGTFGDNRRQWGYQGWRSLWVPQENIGLRCSESPSASTPLSLPGSRCNLDCLGWGWLACSNKQEGLGWHVCKAKLPPKWFISIGQIVSSNDTKHPERFQACFCCLDYRICTFFLKLSHGQTRGKLNFSCSPAEICTPCHANEKDNRLWTWTFWSADGQLIGLTEVKDSCVHIRAGSTPHHLCLVSWLEAWVISRTPEPWYINYLCALVVAHSDVVGSVREWEREK